MWKTILVLGYVLVPHLAVFMLGYGGRESVVSTLFQVFIGSLACLIVYDVYLLVLCVRHAVHKTKQRVLKRFIAVTAILLYSALLAPRLSPLFGRLGAETRLQLCGGELFCSRLLDDVVRLVSEAEAHDGSYLFIERHNMPESFLQLGVLSAHVQAGENAQVIVVTSGRPYGTQWILVPPGGNATVAPPAVKVRPGIYRRY